MRILAALLLFTVVSFGQAPDTKSCSVDGSVVNSANGVPIPRALISLAGADDTVFTESDAAGNWKAEHVTCGPVTLAAERVSFLPPHVKRAPVSLVANTPLHNVKLELTPQAVLTGRVMDDQGDPILDAQVTLMTSRVANGVRGVQASSSAVTDDRGEYRFSGLTAGKYVVCAKEDGRRRYGQKCYPGPVDIEPVATVDVAAGYEGTVDFALSPVKTVRVSGVVLGLPGRGQVTLMLRKELLPGLSAPIRADGTFMIPDVTAGLYILFAQGTDRVTVSVGSQDIEGLQLHAEPGFEVTGAIRFVSVTGRKSEMPQYPVILRSSLSTAFASEPVGGDDDKGTFTIAGLQAGNYRLQFSPPPPFYVKRATLGGRDIIDSEVPIARGAGNLEIEISDDGGVVEADVSADDAPTPAWIMLERDGQPWRSKRSDDNGHVRYDGVPPGDYQIYAWDDNTNVEYENPEWMKRNARGVALTVAPGQTVPVKLIRQIAPVE